MSYPNSLTKLFSLTLAFLGLFTSAAHSADQDDLMEALQQGGYVVYMRHGDTTGEPLDQTLDLMNRAQQRNLSEAGRQQAVGIGAAIRRLSLRVGHVAASPVFRARDTAELAFGVDRVDIDPWLTADDYVRGSYAKHISQLRQYLATPPDDGNTWLIGHVVPLAIATPQITRSNFPEGAAAVFLPKGDSFEIIGILDAGWHKAL